MYCYANQPPDRDNLKQPPCERSWTLQGRGDPLTRLIDPLTRHEKVKKLKFDHPDSLTNCGASERIFMVRALRRCALDDHVQPCVAHTARVEVRVAHQSVDLRGRALTASLTLNKHQEVRH